MSDRVFVRKMDMWNNTPRWGYSIECADCGKEGFYATRDQVRNDPIHASDYFRKSGWWVGKGPRADKCKQCLEKRVNPKPAPTPSKSASQVVPIKGAAETPPRQMSRDDRRIVFAKIDEVYLGEGNGYSREWTDEAVAKDLSVPRAWVTSVREEMFGPAISAEDPQRLLHDIAMIDKQAKACMSSIEMEQMALRETQVAYESHVAMLEKTIKEVMNVSAHVEDLRKRAGQLERIAGVR